MQAQKRHMLSEQLQKIVAFVFSKKRVQASELCPCSVNILWEDGEQLLSPENGSGHHMKG